MAPQEKIQKKAEGFGKLAPVFLEGAKFVLENQWISDNYNPYSINPDSFPEVQWSDEEPTKVKLVIDK